MNEKKVSIIIPVYNAESTIELTLDSVFNQTYPNLEIIVVNDGSTDSTLSILKKYDDKIKLISTVNKGVSAARNTGLKHITGAYVQFLDADDLLTKEKITIQYHALEVAAGDIAYGNWQKFTIVDNEIIGKEISDRQLKEDIEVDIFTDFWCPPAALLYSKQIVDRIGGWKENLPIIQDARYMLEAAIHKAKFVYCPNLVALYRIGLTDSLSNKNALAFVKDVFNNTKAIWEIWKNNKENAIAKKEAIIKSLRYCIHEFSIRDKNLFNDAIDFLLIVQPNYIPSQSGLLKLMSKIVGYRNAERIASYKRKL